MDFETLLRAELDRYVSEEPAPTTTFTSLVDVGRRRQRRGRATAVAVATCLATAVGGVSLAGRARITIGEGKQDVRDNPTIHQPFRLSTHQMVGAATSHNLTFSMPDPASPAQL